MQTSRKPIQGLTGGFEISIVHKTGENGRVWKREDEYFLSIDCNISYEISKDERETRKSQTIAMARRFLDLSIYLTDKSVKMKSRQV